MKNLPITDSPYQLYLVDGLKQHGVKLSHSHSPSMEPIYNEDQIRIIKSTKKIEAATSLKFPLKSSHKKQTPSISESINQPQH
jgi:hypothetical protein